MPRHVRFRAAWGAVIAGLAGAGVGAVGSGATPAGAQAPPTPTIEVAPAEGAAIGDTLTVTGSGFESIPLGALVGLTDASGATIGGYAGVGGVAIADDD